MCRLIHLLIDLSILNIYGIYYIYIYIYLYINVIFVYARRIWANLNSDFKHIVDYVFDIHMIII